MKSIIRSSLLAVLALMMLGGVAMAKEYDVKDFDRIQIGVPGKVTVTQGSEYRVEIEASERTLEKIEVETRGSRLLIKDSREWGFNSWRNSNIKITIVTPEMTSFTISGSADAEIGPFKSKSMDVTVGGSGNINFERIEAPRLHSSISGSGNITIGEIASEAVDLAVSGSGDFRIRGKASRLDASISGSGSMDGMELEVEYAEMGISGSGDVSIHVTEEISGYVSGSGEIEYTGRPAVNVTASGSGRIRHRN